jgi:hypothetical protein
VDLYRGSTLIKAALPVTGGKLSGNRKDKVRLTADVELGLGLGEKLDIDNRRSQLRIYRGLTSTGAADRMLLGVFRVDELDYSGLGEMRIKCSGMESYVLNARFLKPRVPQFAVSAIAQIKQLIQEVLPSATIRVQATRDAPLRTRIPWARERWDAIDALSRFTEVETYSDYSGNFIIANEPDLINGVPVYAISEGVEGVMLDRSENNTRSQVYNAVSVSGTSSDPSVPPFWGWAYVDNPNSPTYYWADPLGPAGGYGQVPRFYTSGFFTNDEQCTRTAQRFLGDALAENVKLQFDSLPLEFLETGDMVAVDMLDGSVSNVLIQTFDYDLGVDGVWQADTMSTKVEAREDGVS